jgi:pimeloyl-ACP methyl ester carboxylesterase
MPKARSNGLELAYDTFGDPSAPALLLVMGLGTQMIAWDEPFCEALAERGFHVVRFDNRDIGLSTWLDHAHVPDLGEVIAGTQAAPYTLGDMATDTVGLLDALGIRSAHLVGASMGGFIVQLVAIEHPERVLSLTSIMSGPGGSDAVPATAEAMAVLMVRPPTEREALIEHGVRTGRVISGPLYDEERARASRTRAVDRAVNFDGTARQLAAIMAAPSRIPGLRGIRLPTLVIHGEVDPLVPLENGRRVAEAVAGARLLTFAEMGHDLPLAIWPAIIDAIAANAMAAETATPA